MQFPTAKNQTPILVSVFLAVWLVGNCIQALTTELAYDEAYYWMWSCFPAWGYYEHPPLVALLIAPGYTLLHNELGVRLLFILLSTATIYLIYATTEKNNVTLLFTTLFSSLYFHITGAAALPGVPLLFFTVLFFLFLRKYQTEENWHSIIALSLIIPLMLYSKYQSILTLLFTICANPSFLKRKSFWIIVSVSALFFMPHVVWQINHGFPTIRLHLFERYREPYTQMFIAYYGLGQPLILGPFIGFIIIITSLRYKPANGFERTLKINLIGFLSFFLLVSFRGKVEPNWTAPAIIPAIILSHYYLRDNPRWKKWLNILAIPSIIMLMIIRIHIVEKILPLENDFGTQFRGWKLFTKEIKAQAGRLPIVAPSYAIASKLSFYGNDLVPSLNADSLSNQYEYWHLIDSLRGATIFFLSPKELGNAVSIEAPTGKKLYGITIENFNPDLLRRKLH